MCVVGRCVVFVVVVVFDCCLYVLSLVVGRGCWCVSIVVMYAWCVLLLFVASRVR